MPGTVETLLHDQLVERREKLAGAAATGDSQVRRLLREVDAALERMDGGTFGLCATCHETIEPGRLVLDPLVEYCLDHLTPPEQRALEQDLDLAGRIQRGLLPPPALTFGRYDVASHYEGAGPVGGDYCDFVEADGGGFHFLIGDVAGKGVAAAMLMAHLHATFRALMSLNLPLEELVARTSRVFCETALPTHFATLVCGRALPSGEVALCNAGHPPPLVLRGREVRTIGATGLPIGMFHDERFAVETVRLSPGDAIVAYTDGVSETRNPAGEEFGPDRLARLASEHAGAAPADLVAACLHGVRTFRAGGRPTDDMTLLALRHRG